MTIEFTGHVEHEVVPLSSVELGTFGAHGEIRFGITPPADDSFRGLWRSEAGYGQDAVSLRTTCADSYVRLMLSDHGDADIEGDVRAIIGHLAKVNAAYENLLRRAEEAAVVAMQRLSD